VRAPVAAAEWESDIAYRYGARLYAQGFFWEAHEVWEAVWKACPPNGIERRLLRGLIALANAALKVRMGRANAALRLVAEADELLGEAGASARTETVMGVAVAPLRAAAQALAAAIRAGGGGTGGGIGGRTGGVMGGGAGGIGEVGRILRPLDPVANGWTPT
jgi:predicted metal-dependent hydrolase